MTPITLSAAVAAEHVRDLERAAHASRLAALARCCHPSQLRRAAARTGTRLRALLQRTSGRPATVACCA